MLILTHLQQGSLEMTAALNKATQKPRVEEHKVEGAVAAIALSRLHNQTSPLHHLDHPLPPRTETVRIYR